MWHRDILKLISETQTSVLLTHYLCFVSNILGTPLSEPTSVPVKDTVLVTCPVPGGPGHVEED